MYKNKIIEIIVGFIIIIIATSFAIYMYSNHSKVNLEDTYSISAKFENIDGIVKGSKVKISGIEIGEVSDISLNKDNFFAYITMKINKDFEIPTDSTAIITTSGIIGKKYIKISPGGDEETLSHDDSLSLTQSTINIEDIISKLLYAFTSKK